MNSRTSVADRGWLLALAALGVVVAAAIGGTGHGLPLWTLDSPGYVRWDVDRTPLYPLLLWLVSRLTPEFGLLAWVQYGALIVTTVVFARALGRLLATPGIGIAVGLLVFLNFYLMRQPTAIHPEAVYLSFILLHCAAVMASLRDSQSRWPALAGLMLGLAILTRPVGYAYIAALPLLVLVWRERRWARSAVLAAGVAVPLLVASLGDYVWRGYFATQAFGGTNLGQQVAEFFPERVDGFPEAPFATYNARLRPIREALGKATDWQVRSLIEALSNGDQYEAMSHLGVDIVAADQTRRRTDSLMSQAVAANQVIWLMAPHVIAAHPLDYLAKAARQFYGLWFYQQLVDPALADRLLDVYRATTGEAGVQLQSTQIKIVPGWVWAIKTVGLAVILLACAAAVVWGLLVADAAVQGLGYLALGVFAYAALTAAVQTAVVRYSLEMWPEQVAATIGLGWLAWRRFRRRPG